MSYHVEHTFQKYFCGLCTKVNQKIFVGRESAVNSQDFHQAVWLTPFELPGLTWCSDHLAGIYHFLLKVPAK